MSRTKRGPGRPPLKRGELPEKLTVRLLSKHLVALLVLCDWARKNAVADPPRNVAGAIRFLIERGWPADIEPDCGRRGSEARAMAFRERLAREGAKKI